MDMIKTINLIIVFAILSISIVASLADDSDATAQILDYNFENNGTGVYRYSFETSNGLKKQEIGEEIPSIHDETNRAAVVRGSYSYPGPDGIIYTVNYVANESGFHPEGAHIKVPPFTPWVPGQPIDDGQYRPDNSGQISQGGEQDFSRRASGVITKVIPTSSTPSPAVTQEYLPTFSSRDRLVEAILSADGSIRSNAVTPKYLPAANQQQFTFAAAAANNNIYRRNDIVETQSKNYRSINNNNNNYDNFPSRAILQKALFNKPTPHPDIVLHSLPTESLISAESKKKIDSRKYLGVKRNIR